MPKFFAKRLFGAFFRNNACQSFSTTPHRQLKNEDRLGSKNATSRSLVRLNDCLRRFLETTHVKVFRLSVRKNLN